MKIAIVAVVVGLCLVAGAGAAAGAPLADEVTAPYRAYRLRKATGDGSAYGLLLVTRGPIAAPVDRTLGGHSSTTAPLPLDHPAITFATIGPDALWDDPFRCAPAIGRVDRDARVVEIGGASYVFEYRPLAEVVEPRQPAPAADRLRDALRAPEFEVRRRAAMTLAALGDRGGVPTLIADLATTAGHDRVNAAVALRILEDDRAIPALRRALRDPAPSIRGIAASALAELRAAGAFDDLVALTRDKEGLDGGKRPGGPLDCIRDCPAFAACYALGSLGDERAVPTLIDLLPDPDLQGSARQALEALIGQKLGADPKPWRSWWATRH